MKVGDRRGKGASGCGLALCQVSMRGRGPKIGGFGDVWDVYGPGRAAGCGAASSRCVLVSGVVGRREHHIILKKKQQQKLCGLKTMEKRLKVSSKGLESRGQIIGG